MNRRTFLRNCGSAAAGVAFTSCELLRAQPGPAKYKRPVRVGGRLVRTIDMHAHCIIPEAVALMPSAGNIGNTPSKNSLTVLPERFAHMDAFGIDMQALSINPFWYRAERDLAAQIVKLQNEKLAELCAQHPDRFVAFATTALQYPDLAVEQLEYGVKKLNLRGASLGTEVAGEELASPRFDPFWAKVEELGVPVFIHPQAISELADRLKGNGLLTNVIGNPLGTTIALSHLIFEGTLDRYPGLKICAAHGGGYLPSYMDRSDNGCRVFPNACEPNKPKKKPTEYLKQMYFDALIFESEALRHLVANVGASQVVLGTDYPYPWTEVPVDHVMRTPSLTDAQRRAILGETAAKLLRVTA